MLKYWHNLILIIYIDTPKIPLSIDTLHIVPHTPNNKNILLSLAMSPASTHWHFIWLIFHPKTYHPNLSLHPSSPTFTFSYIHHFPQNKNPALEGGIERWHSHDSSVHDRISRVKRSPRPSSPGANCMPWVAEIHGGKPAPADVWLAAQRHSIWWIWYMPFPNIAKDLVLATEYSHSWPRI